MTVNPDLIHLVYDTKWLDAFNAHILERINILKESLVMAEGPEVIRLQGAIQELKRLIKLKEIVLSKRD